jgi:hypothetical protein
MRGPAQACQSSESRSSSLPAQKPKGDVQRERERERERESQLNVYCNVHTYIHTWNANGRRIGRGGKKSRTPRHWR